MLLKELKGNKKKWHELASFIHEICVALQIDYPLILSKSKGKSSAVTLAGENGQISVIDFSVELSLKDWEEVLNHTAHELRHIWQGVCPSYNAQTTYIQPEESDSGYLCQPDEVDARAFAALITTAYKNAHYSSPETRLLRALFDKKDYYWHFMPYWTEADRLRAMELIDEGIFELFDSWDFLRE